MSGPPLLGVLSPSSHTALLHLWYSERMLYRVDTIIAPVR